MDPVIKQRIADQIDPKAEYTPGEAVSITGMSSQALNSALGRNQISIAPGTHNIRGDSLRAYVLNKLQHGKKKKNPKVEEIQGIPIKKVCLPALEYMNKAGISKMVINSDGKIQISHKPKLDDIRVIVEED